MSDREMQKRLLDRRAADKLVKDRSAALVKFREGDRVFHPRHNWTGTYDAHPSDTGTAWCTFDQCGQAGVDPRDLALITKDKSND